MQVVRKPLVSAWTSHAGAECALDTRLLILILVHAHECLREFVQGRTQLLHQKRNSGKIETTDSLHAYDTFYERWWVCWAKRGSTRTARGRQAFNSLYFFPSSLEYLHMWIHEAFWWTLVSLFSKKRGSKRTARGGQAFNQLHFCHRVSSTHTCTCAITWVL